MAPPIIYDFQYRETVPTTLRALQWLREHWRELDSEAQAAVTAAGQSLVRYLTDPEQTFKTAGAAADFLYAVEAALPASSLTRDLLRPAHIDLRRGVSFLWDQEIEQLLAALEALPAGLAEMTRPEPAAVAPTARQSQFADPARTAIRVIETLRENWRELPDDLWDQIRDREEELAQALQEAELDLSRASAATRFLNAIDGLAAARRLVAAILDEQRRPVYRDAGSISEQEAASLIEAIYGPPRQAAREPDPFEDPFHQPGVSEPRGEPAPDSGGESPPREPEITVSLHTKVEFPGEVSLFDERVPLIVRLTPDEATVTVAKGVVKVVFEDVSQPEQVDVLVDAEGFEEITGDLSRTILIYAGRASQPAIFLLTPQSAGRKRIVIDFRHKGRPVGSVSFSTEVREPPSGVTAEISAAPGGEPALLAARARPVAGAERDFAAIELPRNPPEPVDLELRITLSADRETLHYQLHSPKAAVGYHWTKAGQARLEAEPRYFMEKTFKRLSRMARSSTERRSEQEDQQYRAELEDIGRYLYEKLFSPELKAEYRKIRQKQSQGLIRNVLITSDEPWIPWELIKPYEADQETGETILDDDFLCSQFRLSRWLAGRGVPDAVHLRKAHLVLPDSNLDYVKAEKAYFESLPDRRPPLGLAGLLQSTADVRQALQNAAAELYHFACHGNFNYDDPDESSLTLGRELFAPSQVIGPVRAGVTKSKPLIFLNACHSGQAGFALTGLGGWAERFVNGGASAFIGTLWEVNDKLAAQFAIHFYDQLWQGASLGDAFHSARQHIRGLDEANPTWLAYTLYADPNGQAKVSASP